MMDDETCSFVSSEKSASVSETIIRGVTLAWPLCWSHDRFRLPFPMKLAGLHLLVTAVQTRRWWRVFTALITPGVNCIIVASSWTDSWFHFPLGRQAEIHDIPLLRLLSKKNVMWVFPNKAQKFNIHESSFITSRQSRTSDTKNKKHEYKKN